MGTGILHLHSTLAYVLLGGLIISILYAFFAFLQKKSYNRKIALLGFITAHLQLLIGIIMYFTSGKGYSTMTSGNGVMKDSNLRLYALEHPLMMIIGIIVITIGYTKAKKMTDAVQQNKTILIYYLIGLILIISRIPWNVWPTISA